MSHGKEMTLAKNYSTYRREIFLIVEWVQFWLASGEVERAIGWAQELMQQVRELSPLAREREDVARARILLAQKMPTEALLLLEALKVDTIIFLYMPQETQLLPALV